MVNNRNKSGMTEEESNDECDMEIIKPTRSELKNAVKLIEQHLLLSQNGSDHPSSKSKWSSVVQVYRTSVSKFSVCQTLEANKINLHF